MDEAIAELLKEIAPNAKEGLRGVIIVGKSRLSSAMRLGKGDRAKSFARRWWVRASVGI